MPAAAPAASDRKLPAFRGAEGFGATTPGGRGGRVLRVTTLADSGPGSLRAALETRGPRIVVFAVSGVIDDERPLCIEEPFVTVAGQTAPGDGITLAGEELRIQAHDVVLRHLRVRTGDARTPHDGWDNRDAVNFGHPRREGDTHDVVLDHCSFSWAVDETLTVWYRSHDITVQHCLLAEPLFHSKHPEGPHSMGILIGEGAANVSLHHNLLADSNGRNPQVAGAGVVDVRDNVVFNWASTRRCSRGAATGSTSSRTTTSAAPTRRRRGRRPRSRSARTRATSSSGSPATSIRRCGRPPPTPTWTTGRWSSGGAASRCRTRSCALRASSPAPP